ncbi:uncharacterized protein LY89DRAFT_760882 [Mollisia scopiformis]|uniref:Gfd2/YDR514C-like C-terminal domain-containing protein n=1 Tax=Mollisia scopiformis TaxID=149040 RepID=A0A132BCF2_MOLSC|nr:uncharacterized protein LY89DRAFT_760882 [Mollisia scopiformis]KUJ10051.1 hypothetical protein LY89DRAFT_760882 [Mollisia scopiformis]
MTDIMGTQVASRTRPVYQDGQLLRYFLGLPDIRPLVLSKECREFPNILVKDVVFLSLDTENITAGQIPLVDQFQVGISVLDSRDLQSLIHSRPLVSMREDNLLRTQNFCVGPTGYCSKAARRFLFGQSESIHAHQIKEKIESLVADRDVVLVVYDGYNDLWLLDELKVKLEPVAVLDPQKAAHDVLQSQYQRSLNDLLIELDCHFNFLHVAGNDANFTLRALLMIAVKGSHGISLNDSQKDHVAEERRKYIAEREEINRRKKEAKKTKKAARKAKLAAEGHWSSTKTGRREFWAKPENARKIPTVARDRTKTG